MHSATLTTKKQDYLVYILLPVYFIVSFIGIYHHEIWLDEAHHFLLARDNNSLVSLIKACRYDGHPLLWNILLFFVTRFTTNVMGMQLLHITINCVTVFFICKSPFSIVEKIFIVFGYYCLFEYNLISRNYGISMLFIVLVIYTYAKNKKALVTLAVLLFLLANTHLFSLLFSMAFTIMYVACNRRLLAGVKKQTLLLAAAIVLLGWVISIPAIIPPADYTHKFLAYETTGYLSPARALKTVSVCIKGLFNVPDYFNYHFFNTFLYGQLPGYILLLLSLVAFAAPVILLLHCRQALYLFVLFSVIYMGAYYFMPLTYGTRYFGFFYLAFMACYWLAYPTITPKAKKLVAVIFFIQFINGIYAYTMDVKYPFSESKNTAMFLQENIKREKVFVINHVPRPGISAYTGKAYFGMENGQQLTYCLWNRFVSQDSIRYILNTKLQQDTGTAIIVSNQPLTGLVDTRRLVQLQVFNKGIERGSDVAIYRYFPAGMPVKNIK